MKSNFCCKKGREKWPEKNSASQKETRLRWELKHWGWGGFSWKLKKGDFRLREQKTKVCLKVWVFPVGLRSSWQSCVAGVQFLSGSYLITPVLWIRPSALPCILDLVKECLAYLCSADVKNISVTQVNLTLNPFPEAQRSPFMSEIL